MRQRSILWAFPSNIIMKRTKVVLGFGLGCLTIWGIFRGAGGDCHAAVIYPKAPDGGRQVAIENVRQLLRAHPGTLGGLEVADLTIAEPYREYFVGLTNLAAGHLLSAARPGSWQYLLLHGTSAAGVAVSNADEKTGKLGFNGLYETAFADRMLEALRGAETLPQIRKQDYELRYLGIPAVNFVAVWLHGKSDDVIIPLPPTFGRLNAYQPYSESEIVKALKRDADQVMKQPKLPR